MADALAPLPSTDLDQLRRTFRGEVITPTAESYDEARRLWNAVHDLRPAVILRPTSAEQVATAIRFGRDRGLEIAVRSGGHSPSGHSSVNDGLVIDLSAMRGVDVDPATRTARANGGALLGELDVAGQAHGLVCPVGVVGHTGVAGLTLGGGVGRLQRRFGLTLDSVAAVELVTADGRIVRASETEEPDLFWGIRGAGWNFGVVTGFELRLHPFGGTLNRGVLMYPGSQAREIWPIFRDYALQAPDTVSLIFGIDRAGPTVEIPEALKGRPIVYVAYNHSGAAEDLERDIAGLRTGSGPRVRDRRARPTTSRSRPRTTSSSASATARSCWARTRTTSGSRRSTSSWSWSGQRPERARSRRRRCAGRSAACPRTRWPTRAVMPRSTSAPTPAGRTRRSTTPTATGSAARWRWWSRT